METKNTSLLILGSGPAGYTAAIYSSRANLFPILITGNMVGGQLTTTYSIENWPGDISALSGIDLMDRMHNHAKKFKVDIINDEILEVDFLTKPFYLIGRTFCYKTDALIIATGASPRYLGISSENKFKGKGVSTCAICDGFFYINKDVVVIGGGNTAVEEALFLSKIARKVFIVHRNKIFSAERVLIHQLEEKVKKEKIILFTNFIVDEILGEKEGVTGIRIKSNINNNKFITISISAVFIAIGHIPNTKIFKDQLKMKNEYISVKFGIHSGFTKTSIEGIFAAGDVIDHVYRQAITSSATGCMAALDAEKYLNKKK
ncbi:thioredoxin-disulfide reductase [Buchnera aphidicola]|uniref:Thioredoxin reductase n=1 Tax=Buchnera aphidicola (Anoecia oenotherae) TaxID=1241833 RepID=A0A4D6XQT9_9GAMM|nr:thioredoxin-disulfide reductase [Buchnera aphidicola]QCI19373.1 thioredoxin-disulfide reductase [Buchnera aphidicola (Anoecia oenotherae)]